MVVSGSRYRDVEPEATNLLSSPPSTGLRITYLAYRCSIRSIAMPLPRHPQTASAIVTLHHNPPVRIDTS